MGDTARKLVPVERNEKRIRKTAWILLVFIIVGGAWIFYAYEKFSRKANADGRPSYAGEIRQNLPVVRQDGQRVALGDLDGKIWVVNAVSATQPESCARSMAVMKQLSEKYRDNPDIALVSLVIDPGAPENAATTLASTAKTYGAILPQWWFATTEPVVLHKFMKDKFRLGMLAHQTAGKWEYDTSLVLIDRDRKLRKAVVPQQRGGAPFVTGFDFDLAASWDAQGVKTGTDRSNEDEMKHLIETTIETLLSEIVNQKEP